MVNKKQIDNIVKIVVDKYNPDKVVLFGSYAKGNPSENSDLDLIIIKDSSEPRYKRANVIRKELRGMKIPIDLLVYTNDEIYKWKDNKSAFVTKALKSGKILYGK
ncbi:nucleotidyltransferase domain-containing protein [bacterium]|nr:nucleotidyltransferase domain-containing protein [bacterium]